MSDTQESAGSCTSPERPTGPMFEGVKDSSEEIYLKPIEKTERLPNDTEVPLQSMIVRSPDEPVSINGNPYDISVDEAKLAGAVNFVRSTPASPGYYDPRGLIIGLREDAQMELANGKTPERKDVHSWKDGNLHIEAPKEIYSFTHSTDELIENFEGTLNDELSVGLLQNRALKQHIYTRKLYTRFGTVAALGLSEGVMIATSNSEAIEVLIARGSLGAAVGAAAVGALVGIKAKIQESKHGSTVAPLARKAYKSGRERIAEVEQNKYLPNGPVISLTPVE